MRTQKEVQTWLDNNPIDSNEAESIRLWLGSCSEYSASFCCVVWSHDGKTLQDVIDFVNSTSPQKDLNPLVAQFEKVEKEIAKLRKLINKL